MSCSISQKKKERLLYSTEGKSRTRPRTWLKVQVISSKAQVAGQKGEEKKKEKIPHVTSDKRAWGQQSDQTQRERKRSYLPRRGGTGKNSPQPLQKGPVSTHPPKRRKKAFKNPRRKGKSGPRFLNALKNRLEYERGENSQPALSQEEP